MAKQIINIGTVANDGTGDPLRSAFDKTNDNFTELYNGQSISIVSDVLTLTRADGTTSTVDLSSYLDEDARAIASGTLNGATGIVTFTRDDASTFTIDLSALIDTASVDNLTIQYNGSNQLEVKDNGLEADKLKTSFAASNGQYPAYNSTTGGFDWGYPNPSVDGTTIGYNGLSQLEVKDDGISYAKLEGRFTDKQDIATTSGTINLDASSYGIFEITSALTGATTLNIQNIKKGQVIDILVTGAQTITMADDFTTSAINQAGSGVYDGASSNHIQVVCIDDNDADAILIYSVATYTSDTDPS